MLPRSSPCDCGDSPPCRCPGQIEKGAVPFCRSETRLKSRVRGRAKRGLFPLSPAGARPFPVFRGFTQSGFDWVLFHIPDDLFPLVAVPNPTVEIVLRPKGSGTFQNPVRFESRSAFDPRDLPRQGVSRGQEQVDVIRHQHPGCEIISPFRSAFAQNLCDNGRHFRFSQPARTGRRRIQQSVPRDEGGPLVVQRSATAATGKEPANRQVTKYPAPSGCQWGRRRCIATVFQTCGRPSRDATEVACPGRVRG